MPGLEHREDSLKTDLYELTMAAGYFQNKVQLRATFELFCYQRPENRAYFIACGLEQAVDFVLNLRFSPEEIDFLRQQPPFKSVTAEFFEYLQDFRFTGNLWAMPEGEIFFPQEPIIQVEAPILEAQILETYLLSTVHIQSLVATKASRVVQAASADGVKRAVVDFGSRRAHGPEAAILAARAAYIAGCAGTSNVYAGKRFAIPIFGTMAHSWVQALGKEEESFRRYYQVFPEQTILLIDTYDTIRGAQRAARLGKAVRGVRLDSGDLVSLSKQVRRLLDRRGLKEVKIFASGNLNEYRIQDLLRKKAPIDAFGVGTEMVVSRDLPSLDLIYKLVETKDKKGQLKYRAKFSPGKKTIAGRKQVFRKYTKKGKFSRDIIGLFSQKPPPGTQPLLQPIIAAGKLVKRMPDIETIRDYTRQRISCLPGYCTDLRKGKYLKTEFTREIKSVKVSLE